MTGYGKPKYGNNDRINWKTHKLKEGSNVYRILPPMKSLSEAGIWAKYYGVHFGYAGTDPKDKTKTRQKTFKCPQEKNRDGMITKRCLECELIEEKSQNLLDRQQQLKAEGRSESEIAELTQPLKDWLRQHNVDRKWYINVMTQAGEFGVLTISHKTKKKLETKLQELLNNEGIDALDPENGVWMNFKRTGQMLQAEDTVEVVQDLVDIGQGRKAYVNRVGALTQQQLADGLTMCPDLTSVVREITLEQIRMLVNSSGDPEEVDQIFSLSSKREKSPAPEQSVKQVEQKAAPAAGPSQADLMAQIAALQAQISLQQSAPVAAKDATPAPAEQPKAEPAPTPAPAGNLQEMSKMAPADFLKQFKLNQNQ